MTQQTRRENQDDFHNPKRAGGILEQRGDDGGNGTADDPFWNADGRNSMRRPFIYTLINWIALLFPAPKMYVKGRYVKSFYRRDK